MKELQGLETLETPTPTLVQTRLGNFEVNPIKMGKFKQFAALALPMVHDAMDCMDGNGDLVALIEKHEQSILDILALTSSFTQEHYAEMLPDDFMSVVLAVIEVNSDFFVQNLMPKVKDRVGGIKERLDKAKQVAGQTKSKA